MPTAYNDDILQDQLLLHHVSQALWIRHFLLAFVLC